MVRLHHGKDFKIGLDFVLVGEEEVAVEKIYPGYPAFKSEAVAVGDVISTVNGTTIRSPAQAVEAMKCRYGRGTDEVVEVQPYVAPTALCSRFSPFLTLGGRLSSAATKKGECANNCRGTKRPATAGDRRLDRSFDPFRGARRTARASRKRIGRALIGRTSRVCLVCG